MELSSSRPRSGARTPSRVRGAQVPQFSEALADRIRERFGDRIALCRSDGEDVTVDVLLSSFLEVCKALRDDAEFAFQQLVDLCGVDYAEYGISGWQTSETATSSGFSRGREEQGGPPADRARFAVVYHLLSHTHNRRLRLRVFLDGEPPRVPSVCEIWSSANWYEREAFDLFGILFDGHPDLRRILTDYGFLGHPFRKDFPLIGNVEMRYDPEKRRVIYEPVSIEPRVLVPKVIPRDHRYEDRDGKSPGLDAGQED